MSTLAVSLARTITSTGAHLLTAILFASLLSVLALVGLVTAVAVLDVVFSFIDAVHASAAEAVQQSAA